MVYNLYEWALPHGYGLVWWTKQTTNIFFKLFNDLIKKVFKKVVMPVLYWSMIVAYGYVFSYMNTLYELNDLNAIEQQITSELEVSDEISTEVLLASSQCSESQLCAEQALICFRNNVKQEYLL